MGLLGRQLPVHMPLGYVIYHTVFKRAMALQPPRILICPHPHSLRTACFEFGTGQATCHIHIVHAAIMKSRPFSLMPFARGKPWGHMAYTHHGQITYITRLDAFLECFQIPRIADIEVDRRNNRGRLGQPHRLPFVFRSVGNRFFGNYMFTGCHSLAYAA